MYSALYQTAFILRQSCFILYKKDQCGTSANKCYRPGTKRCVNRYNSHSCECKPGFTGSTCKTGKFVWVHDTALL